MLTPEFGNLIEDKIRECLNDILPYVTHDININLTLSADVDCDIVKDLSEDFNYKKEECYSLKDSPIVALNHRIEDNIKKHDEAKTRWIISKAQNEILEMVVKGSIDRNFLKRSFTIPKNNISFIESHMGQPIEELRGQFCQVVFDNALYNAYFKINETITGYSCGIKIQWSKNSPLDMIISGLLQAQYDFARTEKYYKKQTGSDFPQELQAGFVFYAIPETKAFKLEINLPIKE